MNNENEVMEKAPVLTKKDCVKGAIRWSLMAITTFNYDTQLAPAVVFGIGPLLRKIYKDDDEYVEALNNHYKYFNTMPWLANIVLGATLALEDKEGITSLDAVQNIKVSLIFCTASREEIPSLSSNARVAPRTIFASHGIVLKYL